MTVTPNGRADGSFRLKKARGPYVRWGLRAVRLAVFTYGLCCLLLYIFQRQVIYHPTSVYEAPGKLCALAAGFEPWTHEGEFLGYKRVGGKPECLFFLHGNAGNARDWSFAVMDYPGDAYVLEYPGYGERRGHTSEAALKRAALQAFDSIPAYARKVVCGESLGSGVSQVLLLNRPRQMNGLVLITPFTSLRDVAAHSFPLFPAGWLLKDKMFLFEEWSRFTGQSTIVLAGADEVIPKQASDPYRMAAGPRRRIITIPGATHNDIHLDATLWAEVTAGFGSLPP